MYHRVAADGPAGLARYRVTAGAFDEQLGYLRDAGYRGVAVDEWGDALRRRQPLPGRCVLITFDDGYADFLTDAWPLLRRHGFPVTLFVPAAHVGGKNIWDRVYGASVPLLDWPALRELRDDGVLFGAHGLSHRPLTALTVSEVAVEAARARAVLEDELQVPVTSLAYPFGRSSPLVAHVLAGCGYLHGLSSRPCRSSLHDHPLALPRIEVPAGDDLTAFVARLNDGL
jgi:peptidoglycan/xylan/chitin deacetylase (PgdA/CDA1 family)